MDRLQLEDFTNYKFLSSLKFSPDSNYTSFIGSEVDLDDNDYGQAIYVLNNTDASTRKLIDLKNKSKSIWKDNETIIFLNDEEGDEARRETGQPFTKVFSIDLKKGEPEFLFEIPLDIKDLKLIDDSNIVFTANFNPELSNYIDLSEEEREKIIQELNDEKDYEVLDEIPFWENGTGFTNKNRRRLYIYNIEEETIRAATDEFTDVYEFKLDKNKENIVLITNSYIDKKYSYTDLQIYNIEDKTLLKISPFDNFKYSYADFLGNQIILIGNDMKDFGINQNHNFYLTSLDGYKSKKISPDSFNFSTRNSIGSDSRYGGGWDIKVSDDSLYFVTTEGDSSFINKIDASGSIEKLTFKKGSIDCLDVNKGRLQFIGLRSLKLQEVYSLNNKKEIQLTDFNGWIIREKTLSIPEKLTFRTEDETLIEGWVMKPTNFKLGDKYPAILNIHGGPKTAFGEVFFHEMQYLANEGYVIFFCNPRGSDGRGDRFADIRGKYGTIDYQDIMDFTDLVLEKYHFIDRNKLGVMGGSYGGFMTNWIIGQTDRFKAAVSQRSISNWISKFATTDIGYYFVDDQIKATPWNDFEKLWDSSPMKYANLVETPTLFIHSQEDYRCWLPEGIQMFTSLKYHGVQTRLCMFKGENHDLSRSGKPRSRIKRLIEIKDWFQHYLK